jgi:hypothetical protein
MRADAQFEAYRGSVRVDEGVEALPRAAVARSTSHYGLRSFDLSVVA